MTAPTEPEAWALILALADRAGRGRPILDDVGLRLDASGKLVEGRASEGWIVARPSTSSGWAWPNESAAADPGIEQLLDLYVPLCLGQPGRGFVVGHLAQSLDGRIATLSGASQFITGDDNLVHAHRMRALCDAVIVGSRTVHADDPQLTTRRVPGANPTRVVLDPARRLESDRRVFQDGASATLLLCTPEAARRAPSCGQAEVVAVDGQEGHLPVAAVLAELRRRGLARIFIEGGGVTVSHFLHARVLTRLHVAVAPVLFGSGRPAFSLPVIDVLSDAVALECRHFVMGRDILFDCVIPPRAGDGEP